MHLSLWLLACGGEVAVEAPAPPIPAPPPVAAAPGPAVLTPPTVPAKDGPQVETLLGAAPGIHFVGDWTSKGCASRTHARNIRFLEDHTWAAIDLLTPCPPGQECGWSGMVTYSGIWQMEGSDLKTREIGAPIEAGGPHPTLFHATNEGKLIENQCLYEPGLTVPEGYTAERVTPVPQK